MTVIPAPRGPALRLLAAPLALLCLLLLPGRATATDTPFARGIALLAAKDFQSKGRAIDLLAESNDPRARPILTALLAGRLFHVRKTGALVLAEKEGRTYRISDALSGAVAGTVKKRALRKVTINNRLRSRLKGVLARMDLSDPDASVRLAAVNAMLATLDPGSIDLLEQLRARERDSRVRDALATAIAIGGLRSTDRRTRLAALAALHGNLHPAVRNELTRLIRDEKDQEVRGMARATLASIETRIAWSSLAETLFFGLSAGSVLVLAAIGLAITFGVIGVINMAHGELIMLGAYTTYVLQQLLPHSIGLALLLSVPAAFVVSGAVGIVIEKTVIRFLYGRPLETLLATFGISLVLQQAVRTIFSPLNRSVATPAWMSGMIQVNPVLSLTVNRLTIIAFTALVFAGLYWTMKKSAMGLQVRAVAQNRAMARAMGVRAARVDALTFGLGSGIAGMAGVALSQLTNVGPNLGQSYIIDSFMVVVFGGVGNLWGTLLGGLSLGVANKFMEPWTGAVLAKILILVFIILFIQKRPSGLFPQGGRAEV